MDLSNGIEIGSAVINIGLILYIFKMRNCILTIKKTLRKIGSTYDIHIRKADYSLKHDIDNIIGDE